MKKDIEVIVPKSHFQFSSDLPKFVILDTSGNRTNLPPPQFDAIVLQVNLLSNIMVVGLNIDTAPSWTIGMKHLPSGINRLDEVRLSAMEGVLMEHRSSGQPFFMQEDVYEFINSYVHVNREEDFRRPPYGIVDLDVQVASIINGRVYAKLVSDVSAVYPETFPIDVPVSHWRVGMTGKLRVCLMDRYCIIKNTTPDLLTISGPDDGDS